MMRALFVLMLFFYQVSHHALEDLHVTQWNLDTPW